MNETAMRIITRGTVSEGDAVSVEFLMGAKNHPVSFRSRGESILSGNLESFLTCALLASMRAGATPMIAEGRVSAKFLSALDRIQDIFLQWDPTLHRVEISGAVPVPAASSSEHRVGTFFSGGVDSFFTLLKHLDEVTDIIFVHGLDIRLDDTALREKSSAKIREVAAGFGKNVIELETNIRELFNPYIPWGLLGNGAALAAIGHLLFPALHRIYIPASHTYAELFPWGSHPILDHLWSSESLEFVHDGCEATRVEKVALLARCDVALHSLRVCWENPHSAYNCGRCEKCLRTMINLRVNNALERCTTFDAPFDVRNVYRIDVEDDNTRAFFRQNLDALRRSHADPELERALETTMKGPPLIRRLKRRVKKALVRAGLRKA